MTFISILIPFKKGRRFLKDCLESIHEQGLDNFEIILIVNGADEDIDDLVNFPDNIVIKEFDEELALKLLGATQERLAGHLGVIRLAQASGGLFQFAC